MENLNEAYLSDHEFAAVENAADEWFGKFGFSMAMTNHFKDRVNRQRSEHMGMTRNELEQIFEEVSATHSRKTGRNENSLQQAIREMRKDISVPFSISISEGNGNPILVTKAIITEHDMNGNFEGESATVYVDSELLETIRKDIRTKMGLELHQLGEEFIRPDDFANSFQKLIEGAMFYRRAVIENEEDQKVRNIDPAFHRLKNWIISLYPQAKTEMEAILKFIQDDQDMEDVHFQNLDQKVDKIERKQTIRNQVVDGLKDQVHKLQQKVNKLESDSDDADSMFGGGKTAPASYQVGEAMDFLEQLKAQDSAETEALDETSHGGNSKTHRAPRDPNWKRMQEIRKSGASGVHKNKRRIEKTLPRKAKHGDPELNQPDDETEMQEAVGIVDKENATCDVPVGGEYMNVKGVGIHHSQTASDEMGRPKKKKKKKSNESVIDMESKQIDEMGALNRMSPTEYLEQLQAELKQLKQELRVAKMHSKYQSFPISLLPRIRAKERQILNVQTNIQMQSKEITPPAKREMVKTIVPVNDTKRKKTREDFNESIAEFGMVADRIDGIRDRFAAVAAEVVESEAADILDWLNDSDSDSNILNNSNLDSLFEEKDLKKNSTSDSD